MSAMVQLVGGHFMDAEGNPLAGGYLTFLLNNDESVNDSQIAAGVEITVPLDAFGDVVSSPGVFMWGNDVLSPINSYYRVTGYTAEGQTAFGPNSQQVVGTGTFDLGSWIPNTVISWFPSPQPLNLEVNSVPASSQTTLNLTGSGVTDEGGGTIQISSGGSGLSSTTVTVSASQLLSLNTTAVQIVAPQGLGTLIVPVAVIVNYVAGGTPFSPTTDGKYIQIQYTNVVSSGNGVGSTFNQVLTTGFIDQATNEIAYLPGGFGNVTNGNNPYSTSSSMVNQGLYLAFSGEINPLTAGSGHLVVTTYYTVLTGAV